MTDKKANAPSDRGVAGVIGKADDARFITNRSSVPAVDQEPIMPIGKHKGRLVAEVMATDPMDGVS
jgi:hypothetical protein